MADDNINDVPSFLYIVLTAVYFITLAPPPPPQALNIARNINPQR